jgi:hypothetical protein
VQASENNAGATQSEQFFDDILRSGVSGGKDSPELREKDRTLCGIFDEVGP